MPRPVAAILDAPGSDPGRKPDPIAAIDGSNGDTVRNDAGQKRPAIIEGFDAYDPADSIRIDTGSGDGDSAGSARRTKSGRIDRRTRAGRAGSTQATEKISPVVVDLSTLLFAFHETASTLLSIEELSIDESEADKLSEKIKKVSAFYPNTGLPPKVMAWLELGAACTMIYGTRIKAYTLRKSKEPKEPKPSKQQTQAAPAAPFVMPRGNTVTPKPNGKAPSEMSPSEVFGFQGAMETEQ